MGRRILRNVMRFDEAFDFIVDACIEADKRVSAAANDTQRNNMRKQGCDIWIADIVRAAMGITDFSLPDDNALCALL